MAKRTNIHERIHVSCRVGKLIVWFHLCRLYFYFLTSSLRHPKIFVKEFSDFLMSCHQHCLGVNLLVQR